MCFYLRHVSEPSSAVLTEAERESKRGPWLPSWCSFLYAGGLSPGDEVRGR